MIPIVISSYLRSPFTPAYKGELATIRPDDMAAQVIKALVMKSGVKPEDIEDIMMGCAFPEGEQGLNIARLVTFIAGLPISIAGTTINRFCGSSMQAIHSAAGAIACGSGEVFICAGVESMTRIPMAGFNPSPNPDLFESFPEAYESMGITAENVAKKYDISRKEQEEFAVSSHQKATNAAAKLLEEIVPITGKHITVSQDGCVRSNTTVETLSTLAPAFDKDGTVTAGTSSPLTDGAAAVLVCSEEYADRHNLPKLARIKSMAIRDGLTW